MVMDWVRKRLLDDSFHEARSLTAAFVLCMALRVLVIDQRVVSFRVNFLDVSPTGRSTCVSLSSDGHQHGNIFFSSLKM